VEGAGEQFFPGAGLPQNQDGGLAGCDGGYLVEYFPERWTVANDFGEMTFGMDLAFQILLLFRESLLEAFDLSRGAMVFERHGELGGDLAEQA